MNRRMLLVPALVAGVAPTGWAQARPDSVARDSARTRLQPVTVVAPRATTAVGGASAVVVSVDSLRLPPAPVLEDVLRELPFVLVRQNSRGESEISVRGSDSRQAAVMLDGLPLTLGWDHRSDPSIVPIAGARSIVLVRGLSSLLHGPNSLGGVLELGVNQGEIGGDHANRTLELRGGVDHLGAQSYHALAGAPIETGGGTLLLRGGLGYRTRDDIALGGDLIDRDGRSDRRTNSDLSQLDGFAAVRYQRTAGPWLGVSASAYRAERGVPPEMHVAQPRFWRYPDLRRLLAVASAGSGRFRTPFGAGDAEASIGINAGSSELESFATESYSVLDGRESSDDRTVTARVFGDHSLGSGELRNAITFADVTYDERIDGDAVLRYQQRLWSVASEVELPLAGSARWSGGLAFDGADTPRSGDKPPLGTLTSWGGRMGLSALAFGGSARLHASASQRARFPALRELYSGALGRFVPNPSLRPERLLGLEAGATLLRTGVQLQSVLFHHRMRDAIVRADAGGGQLRRENRDQIRSTGLELLGGWSSPALSMTADLLLQHVRVIDVAAASVRHPENQPAFRVGADATAPIAWGVTGIVGAEYVGTQYCLHPDLGREISIAGKGRANAAIEREWRLRGDAAGGLLRTLRTTLSLDNVADAAIYDQCGLPQPGRTLRFGFVLR